MEQSSGYRPIGHPLRPGDPQQAFDFYLNQPRRPVRPERLYLGLFWGADDAARIGDVGAGFVCDHHLPGKLIEPARLHLSLHHLGDYKRLRGKVIYAAQLAGSAVSLPSFDLTFRFIKTFDAAPSRHGEARWRPLVLLTEAEALSILHATLGDALQRNGLRSARHFTPHVTLFYGPQQVPLQEIAPISVPVRDFTLIHSRRGLGEYRLLGRWPLRNQDAV